MMKHFSTRVCTLLLVIAILIGVMAPVGATETDSTPQVSIEQVDNSIVKADPLLREVPEREQAQTYADTDVVRVSIVLKEASTISAGYSTNGIAANAEAMTYRAGLRLSQSAVTRDIERQALGGNKLDVVWNLALAANAISANVEY